MTDFLTIPDELVYVVKAGERFFLEVGYSVEAEKGNIEFPYTPSLYCSHQKARVFVEVSGTIDFDIVDEWVSYGRSCSTDTRVVIAVPSDRGAISQAELSRLKDLGVGVLEVGADAGDARELLAPRDLTVNISPPKLSNYSNGVRKRLGLAWQQLRRGDWREGFESACVALENAARVYLKREMARGRITLVTQKGKARNVTAKQIDKMPMGALKDCFKEIAAPNKSDSVIAAALERVNPDRIRVAHKKDDARADAALRRNVGRHLWTIANAMHELM